VYSLFYSFTSWLLKLRWVGKNTILVTSMSGSVMEISVSAVIEVRSCRVIVLYVSFEVFNH